MNEQERNKRYKKLTLFYRDIFRDIVKAEPLSDQKKYVKEVEDIYGERKILLTAGRRSGKSFTFSITALWYALFVSKIRNEPMRICIVAGSLAQSREVMLYVNNIISKYSWIEKEIATDSTHKLKRSQTKVTFKDGSSIEALATSIRSITGKGANLLIVDEASVLTKTGNVIITRKFMKDYIEPLTWTPFSRILMGSTPYIYDSYFTDCYLDRNEGYKVFRWDLRKRKDLPKSIFEEAKKEGDAYQKIYIEGIPARISRGMLTSMFLKPLVRTREEINKLIKDTSSARIAGVDFASVGITGLVIIDFNPVDPEFPYKVLFDKGFEEIDNKKLVTKISYYLRKFGVTKTICDSNLPSKIHSLKEEWKGEVKGQSFQHGQGFLLNQNLKEIILKKKILFIEPEPEILMKQRKYDPNKYLVSQLIGYEFRKDILKVDDLIDGLMLALSEQSEWLHKHPEIRLQQSKTEMSSWIEGTKDIVKAGWKIQGTLNETEKRQLQILSKIPEEAMLPEEKIIWNRIKKKRNKKRRGSILTSRRGH